MIRCSKSIRKIVSNTKCYIQAIFQTCPLLICRAHTCTTGRRNVKSAIMLNIWFPTIFGQASPNQLELVQEWNDLHTRWWMLTWHCWSFSCVLSMFMVTFDDMQWRLAAWCRRCMPQQQGIHHIKPWFPVFDLQRSKRWNTPKWLRLVYTDTGLQTAKARKPCPFITVLYSSAPFTRSLSEIFQ